jgi:O-Antigen ligase
LSTRFVAETFESGAVTAGDSTTGGWRSFVRDPLFLPGVLAFGAFFGLAELHAGYAVTVWSPAAVFLLALTVVAMAFVPRRRLDRPTIAAIGCLAAFTIWSFVSISWAGVRGIAWDGANRTLLYLVVFVLFASLPWRAATVAALLGAYAFAIGVAGTATLAAASRARDPTDYFLLGRFAQPADYQNAECALFLAALWPALLFAARRSVPWWIRAAMTATAGVLLELALLTQTRASIVALPLTLFVFLALTPNRARVILFSLPPALAVVAASRPLLHVFTALQVHEGVRAAVVSARTAVLVSAAALFVIGAVVSFVDGRVSLGRTAARRASLAFGAAFVVASVVALVLAAIAVGDPVKRWDQFRTTPSRSTKSYFSNGFGSNRYDIWRVAAIEFEHSPVRGVGTDNFAVGYLRERRSVEEPLYPHSLELRALVQTGVVGALLLLGFFLAAVLRLRRTATTTTLARGTAAAAVGVFAYWFFHGSVDWFWELPGLGCPALACLGLAGTLRRPESGPPVPLRVPLAVAGLAIALVAAASLTLPWLSAQEVEQAGHEWKRHPASAFSRLDRARRLNPLSDDPDLVAGAIASRLGDHARMAASFRRAIVRNPENWYAWLELGIAESLQGRRTEALAALARGHALDPGEDTIPTVAATVRAGKRVDPGVIDRTMLGRIPVR